MRPRIYLSGATLNVDSTISDLWREYISTSLDGEFEVFNPNTHVRYEDGYNARLNMDYLLTMVEKCDVVIVNLFGTSKSVGTAYEVQKAKDAGKLIIGFQNYDAYDYTADCCSYIFETMDDVIDFIRNHMF